MGSPTGAVSGSLTGFDALPFVSSSATKPSSAGAAPVGLLNIGDFLLGFAGALALALALPPLALGSGLVGSGGPAPMSSFAARSTTTPSRTSRPARPPTAEVSPVSRSYATSPCSVRPAAKSPLSLLTISMLCGGSSGTLSFACTQRTLEKPGENSHAFGRARPSVGLSATSARPSPVSTGPETCSGLSLKLFQLLASTAGGGAAVGAFTFAAGSSLSSAPLAASQSSVVVETNAVSAAIAQLPFASVQPKRSCSFRFRSDGLPELSSDA